MKKLLLCALVLSAVVVAQPVSGAFFGVGDNYILPEGREVNENLYAAGGNVSVVGDVTGDLTAAGGTVLVSGDVTEDVTIAGGNVILQGNTAGDVRAAGGTVTLFGGVGGEVVLGGGQVTIADDAVIAGELTVAGKRVIVNGKISGPVKVYAGSVVIGESAVLESGLTYHAPKQAEIHADASIRGEVVFNEIQTKGIKIGMWSTVTVLWVVKLVMSLTLALVLFAFFRKQVQNLVKSGIKEYGWNLLRGFVLMILLPVAAMVLFITVVGVPLGVIALLLMGLGCVLGIALAGILLGALIMKFFKKSGDHEVTAGSVILGVILLHVLYFIPFVGWLAIGVFFLTAFGTIFTFGYKKFKDGK